MSESKYERNKQTMVNEINDMHYGQMEMNELNCGLRK